MSVRFNGETQNLEFPRLGWYNAAKGCGIICRANEEWTWTSK